KQSDGRVFKDMVSGLLVRPAKEATSQSGANTRQLLGFSAGSQMLQVLDAMSTWKTNVTGVTLADVKLVRKFLERSLSGHWTICGNCRVARLHGDFHSRNIFVSPTSGAIVIDFARSAEFPRLLDFAALEADLLLSVLCSKDGED